MNEISVSTLKKGMRFSEDVYIDDNHLWVPANLPIKERDLMLLKKWEVPTVFTDGSIVKVSNKNDTSQVHKISEQVREKDKEPEPPRKGQGVVKLYEDDSTDESYDLYSDSIEKTKVLYNKYESKAEISHHEIDTIVDTIVNHVSESKNMLVRFILSSGKHKRSSAKSAVDCVILSAVIAKDMNLPRHKITQIATGALLHDIGMKKVPQEILEKEGKLTKEEMDEMRHHPEYSYRIITKDLGYPEPVGMVALQHHERWDGSGYPNNVTGEEISIGARIVTVADAFEAMVSERPYRNSMIGYSAMRNILSDNSRRFDPDILKVFIKSMGIYPLGSIVLLSDSSIGRVIETHMNAPLRPKLRIMVDKDGNEFSVKDQKTIDLMKERKLFIVRALDPKEYAAEKQKKNG
ncbi:MAG: HD-GYP domain-containing protein [Spirochaetia bacterium]